MTKNTDQSVESKAVETDAKAAPDATAGNAAETARTWARLADNTICAIARRVTKNKTLASDELSQPLRIAIVAILLSMLISVGGSIWLGRMIMSGVAENQANFDSAAFRLALVNNAPFELALAVLVVGGTSLAIACSTRSAPRTAYLYLAIPVACLAITHMVRGYAGGLLGNSTVIYVRSLLSNPEEASKVARGKAIASAALDIPGLRPELATSLRLELLKAHVDSNSALDAFLGAKNLLKGKPGPDVLVVIVDALKDIMYGLGQSRDAAFCCELYSDIALQIPESKRPSPFWFAILPTRGWEDLKTSWDSEKRFESESDNLLLRALTERFPKHPDRPYMLFLLGDASQLEADYPTSRAGLLAAFTLARTQYKAGIDSKQVRQRLQRILASDSDQSFVDDAAVYLGSYLIRANDPVSSIDVLCKGLGRGNNDRTSAIERLLLQAGQMLDRTALDQFVSRVTDLPFGDTRVLDRVKSKLLILAAWRSLSVEWTPQLIRGIGRYLETPRGVIAEGDGRPARWSSAQLSGARDRLTDFGEFAKPLCHSKGDPSRIVESLRRMMVLVKQARGDLRSIGIGVSRDFIDGVARQLTRFAWISYLTSRDWWDTKSRTTLVSAGAGVSSPVDAHVINRELSMFGDLQSEHLPADTPPVIERIKARLARGIPRGVLRDVMIANQLDDIRDASGVEWLLAKQRIDQMATELQSDAQRVKFWTRVSMQFMEFAQAARAQPALHALYVDRALDAFLASKPPAEGIPAEHRARFLAQMLSVLTDVPKPNGLAVLEKEFASFRGVLEAIARRSRVTPVEASKPALRPKIGPMPAVWDAQPKPSKPGSRVDGR